jgi:hypothetical protein
LSCNSTRSFVETNEAVARFAQRFDDRGQRCNARSFLEHHHVEARAKGGSGESDNIQLLCRTHNQLFAEIEFGRAHVERAKTARLLRSELRPSRDGI